MKEKSSLGGERIQLECPKCGYEITVLDRNMVEFGPVRCGACGEKARSAQFRRLVEDALAARPQE